MSSIFKFKQFSINQENAPFKIGTDGVLLGAWCVKKSPFPKNILDIGTGTGVIALMLAQRFPASKVEAIEINLTAFNIAKQNFNNSIWNRRINISKTSLQNFTPIQTFDLIACNPPYFVNSKKSGAPGKDVARHAIELNFDAILHFASKHLSVSGTICLVIPFERNADLVNIAAEKGLYPRKICEVFPTPHALAKRVLVELGKTSEKIETTTLIIEENGRHQYSAEYKKLTKDFYLKF